MLTNENAKIADLKNIKHSNYQFHCTKNVSKMFDKQYSVNWLKLTNGSGIK